MAQMVARRIGNAEVTGSIPVASFFSILHYINIIADRQTGQEESAFGRAI